MNHDEIEAKEERQDYWGTNPIANQYRNRETMAKPKSKKLNSQPLRFCGRKRWQSSDVEKTTRRRPGPSSVVERTTGWREGPSYGVERTRRRADPSSIDYFAHCFVQRLLRSWRMLRRFKFSSITGIWHRHNFQFSRSGSGDGGCGGAARAIIYTCMLFILIFLTLLYVFFF